MFGLTRLWNAIASLATRLEALAATVGTIDTEIKQRMGMDGAGPVLEHLPAALLPATAEESGRPARAARGRK
jgi:hypothetical protein